MLINPGRGEFQQVATLVMLESLIVYYIVIWLRGAHAQLLHADYTILDAVMIYDRQRQDMRDIMLGLTPPSTPSLLPSSRLRVPFDDRHEHSDKPTITEGTVLCHPASTTR